MNVKTFSKDMINKIADLSQNMYPIITNMDLGITYVPEKTAEFLGFSREYYEDFFYGALLEKVNEQDIPEYKEEIAKRLKGQDLSEELYIRMGKREKDHMMGFYIEFMHEKNNNECYMVLVLKDATALQDIDPYTYLYGQPKYERDIEHYIRLNRKVAVIEVEIEHIDEINILYGANFSNAIQREMALKYIFMMDNNKAVYHLNNSKFVFILRDADRDDAYDFLQLVYEVIRSTDVFKGNKFDFDVYSSCIILKDYEGETSTVLSKLEYTLDRAKERRTHELVFFNDMVKVNGEAHINIMKVIHSSVLNNCDGFYVEYQPIVCAKTGKIAGAEALVRWKKDTYGVVPPGMFIDWLEDTPAMYELGNYVMRTALRDATEFRRINSDFFININASAEQLERVDFGKDVVDMLSEFDFPSENMWLEITERCRALPMSVIKSTIEFIKKTGVHIAMDDYGTGSASSQMLIELPIDEVKIDMSFIKQIQSEKKKQAMVKSIIDFANSVGMNSCIEGIEDEKLQNYLRDYDSTWFQGYHYSKPIGAAALKQMLVDAS